MAILIKFRGILIREPNKRDSRRFALLAEVAREDKYGFNTTIYAYQVGI